MSGPITDPSSEPISVLMAVWSRDRADWLREALDSVVAQTHSPTQVVLVQDGPIGADLQAVLDAAEVKLPLHRIELPVNGGLAAALEVGLAHCRHELVARVDADDICVPERFAHQVQAMLAEPDLSVLGGYVAEFEDDPAQPYAVREVPVGRAAVARAARWRAPVNHPSVMLRRSHVLSVGGYAGFVGIEDYYLWAKLLAAGRPIDNLPLVLVRMRAGAALGHRRGGLAYARVEAALFRQFVRIGFLSPAQALLGLAVRLPVRLVPGGARAWVYRHVLRRPSTLG